MKNIICFGDSITHGEEFPPQQRWTSLLQQRLDAEFPSHYRVYNRGIGGNTTAQGMDRFEYDVLPLLPGLLLIEFGFNDANIRDWSTLPRVSLNEFARNLREFHAIAQRQHSTVVFIINHLIGEVPGQQGNGATYNTNFAAYNACIRSVAQDLKAAFIDLPAMMQERGLDDGSFVSADGIHLSDAANSHYAEMVYSGLVSLFTAEQEITT